MDNDEDFTPDENAHRKKIDRAAESADHYAAMGLQDLRWAATDNEIKKAYRKMVLLYHPDKLAERGEKGGEETFRGIQKAYDILSDPEKRRDYDSQDAPKDEKYPGVEQLVAAPDFYKMAGDIFRRQARWSKVDDVPVIGDDKTPIGEVKEFYNWWMQMYESWRTWKHEDEYDLNQAENRNERRWMERQNEKLQRSFKQAEKTSLAEFVQAAQRADPRMKRWREEQQRKKDAKKEYQQSEADKRSLLEQQAREGEELKAREVAEKEAAEKDAQKKNREKEKRRRKEAQKTFRAVCAKLYSDEEKTLTPEHVEIVAGASQVSVEELRTLTAALRDKGKEAIEGGFAAVLRDVMFKRSGPIAVAAAASASPARGNDNNNNNEAVVTEATPWTLDELSHLARATNKYPGGFTERWEHIMADLKHFGIHRTLADVQARAVELKKGKQASLVVDEDQVNRDIIRKVESNKLEAAPSQNYNAVAGDPNVWTNAQMKQLQEGLQAVPKDADKRFETIAAKYVPGKSAEQCAEKFKALVAVAKQKSAAAAAGSGPKTAIAQATAEEWTLEQQKQLEHGLKTVPADDPWRWDKIAAGVTGKDRKQVVSRYNELVQRLKKK